MSATTAGNLPRPKAKVGSMERQRRMALWGSYIALSIFVVIFLSFFILLTQFLYSQDLPVAAITVTTVIALFFVLVAKSWRARTSSR